MINISVTNMENLIFVDNPMRYVKNHSFVAYISTVYSEQDLFQILSTALKFPDYFGFNWDALCELYSDFWWINEKRIIIVHECILTLDKKSLVLYLKQIMYALNFWREYDDYYVEFVFSTAEEKMINSVLASILYDNKNEFLFP